MDDLPQYVTLVGSGFFQWEETVCYYGSQSTSDVIFVNTTHLQCKVRRLTLHLLNIVYREILLN